MPQYCTYGLQFRRVLAHEQPDAAQLAGGILVASVELRFFAPDQRMSRFKLIYSIEHERREAT